MDEKQKVLIWYSKWAYEHKMAEDIYDIEAKINSGLNADENISIIEADLKILAENGTLLKENIKREKSRIQQEVLEKSKLKEANILSLFNEPKVIAVCGDINEAKSNLIYHLITVLKAKFDFKVYSYGLRADVGEQKIFSIEELEKIKNSVIVVDEFTNLWDVEDRKKRRIIETSLRLIYHNNNIVIISGNAENFKKFISAKISVVFFKKSTLTDFINGSRLKTICMNYTGLEMGSSVLDLEKSETLIFDGEHYSKISVPYYPKYDSKRENVEILVQKNVHEKNVIVEKHD